MLYDLLSSLMLDKLSSCILVEDGFHVDILSLRCSVFGHFTISSAYKVSISEWGAIGDKLWKVIINSCRINTLSN